MRGWKGTCDKCVGPPTCDCFVSSTDVLEGVGPSSAGVRPMPSPKHPVAQSNPLGSPGMLVEGSAHTSPLEVVVEESVDLHQEDCVYYVISSLFPYLFPQ